MNILWIIFGAVVFGLLARKVLRRPDRPSDLGFVSHQWIAEHRLAQTQDAQR